MDEPVEYEHEGQVYQWFEKGRVASLFVGGKCLYWGRPSDPKMLVPLRVAPLEVLLAFSKIRLALT